MSNTFTQLYVHIVFSVKNRRSLISFEWSEKLYKYIAGTIANKKQKLILINGMPDHLHVLAGFKPDCNLSDLVRDIKSNSSRWINDRKLVGGRFEWQTGFGAFSLGQSQLEHAINYITNQQAHHQKTDFQSEYKSFLQAYKIEFEEKYLPGNVL